MDKSEWIAEAASKLAPYMGVQSCQYAESLYETYEVADGSDCTPDEAIAEDFTYWGD